MGVRGRGWGTKVVTSRQRVGKAGTKGLGTRDSEPWAWGLLIEPLCAGRGKLSAKRRAGFADCFEWVVGNMRWWTVDSEQITGAGAFWVGWGGRLASATAFFVTNRLEKRSNSEHRRRQCPIITGMSFALMRLASDKGPSARISHLR